MILHTPHPLCSCVSPSSCARALHYLLVVTAASLCTSLVRSPPPRAPILLCPSRALPPASRVQPVRTYIPRRSVHTYIPRTRTYTSHMAAYIHTPNTPYRPLSLVLYIVVFPVLRRSMRDFWILFWILFAVFSLIQERRK
ncbi:hypothetical protein C8R44DRAFT_69389 [Mycena epipterygia]|nr:hypothetical protein C8R44DRAFT_69389 [Mycena epipterygia]